MDKLLPFSKRLAWKIHLCRGTGEERDGGFATHYIIILLRRFVARWTP